MKEEKTNSSSAIEVKSNGITLTVNWAVVQHLIFWGLLLGSVLVLAANGDLVETILKQFVGAVVALYFGKTCL